MISTINLQKRFDEFACIDYDDLTFETGKSYVLLGASGCGKSTLLNLISGVISPTSGSVIIDDKNMSGISQSSRDSYRVRHIGYVFQDFKLLEDMTVQDNIDVLRLENVDVSNSDAILDTLGILRHKRKKVDRLSGGEKQRVAIARALVKAPDIILADEPTGNLNYTIGRGVMEALISAAKGKTLLCVTHDDRLTDLFDCVLDMNKLAHWTEGGSGNA